MQAIPLIALFTLREALRERLIRALVAMVGVGLLLVVFIGELLLNDSLLSRAVMLGFFLRLGSLFLMMVLVTFATARDLHNRALDLMLALPLPRGAVFLGRACGYFFCAWLVAGVCGLTLWPLVRTEAVVLWSLSLGCELLIMSLAAMVLTLTLGQAPFALTVTTGFYLLARSISALLLIAAQSSAQSPHWSTHLTQYALQGISWVLPGLDRFATGSQLLLEQNVWLPLWPILGETGIYLVFLTALGLFDFYQREF